MSGRPGMQLMKSIKADPALQHLRCIAIEASVAGDGREDLRSAGFEDRWPKPLDLKMIWSGLNAVLAA
jgi:CheY-like chemotaxis protein